jgi:hypothetical protein
MQRPRPVVPDLYADPFRERYDRLFHFDADVLGARFRFQSNSQALLKLARRAYQDLPRHRFNASMPRLTVQLLLRPPALPSRRAPSEPAVLDMFSIRGWLGAGSLGSDCVLLSPSARTALVVVSRETAASAYHTRYELIEFAVFTLATRCQRLIPLHAACVGAAGQGVLLMGASGAGKSTVTMLSLMRGLEFLSEDAVFVATQSMRASGVANYLHVRADSLRWLEPAERRAVRRSPVIRRRSGVRKYELDLRRGDFQLARAPLQCRALVFLSARPADGELLRPLSASRALSRLATEQAYARSRPEWPRFCRRMAALPAFELRRGKHPAQAVDALQSLLARD